MAKGIVCPACDSKNTKVYESRRGDNAVVRRRQCLECDTRFATEERVTHMIRLMDSFTVKRGREETFPSDLHILALRSIASGADNRSQVALAIGVTKQHSKRLVDRLVKAKLVDNIFGSAIEGQHPLTTVVQITPEGASFLARSSPPKRCDDD